MDAEYQIVITNAGQWMRRENVPNVMEVVHYPFRIVAELRYRTMPSWTFALNVENTVLNKNVTTATALVKFRSGHLRLKEAGTTIPILMIPEKKIMNGI